MNPGDKVKLIADPVEGWEEQDAVIVSEEVGYPRMFIVRVEPEDADDDGLREVEDWQIGVHS